MSADWVEKEAIRDLGNVRLAEAKTNLNELADDYHKLWEQSEEVKRALQALKKIAIETRNLLEGWVVSDIGASANTRVGKTLRELTRIIELSQKHNPCENSLEKIA